MELAEVNDAASVTHNRVRPPLSAVDAGFVSVRKVAADKNNE
jgi:hypothetical protein